MLLLCWCETFFNVGIKSKSLNEDVKMNKKILGSAIVMAFAAAGVSTSASAALASNSVLNFSAASVDYYTGFVNATSGSWFSMDNDGNSKVGAAERVAIGSDDGIVLGTAQAASGSHPGAPGTVAGENGSIDLAWSFFGNTGFHQTTSAASVITSAGNTATIDMSGWNVTWSGIPSIPMGSGSWNPLVAQSGPTGFSNGVAVMACNVDCAVGDTYTLNYSATVPLGDASGFGGVKYFLHLQGTIAAGSVNAVPVPAAAWLFGSGLLGLAGVARRRVAA